MLKNLEVATAASKIRIHFERLVLVENFAFLFGLLDPAVVLVDTDSGNRRVADAEGVVRRNLRFSCVVTRGFSHASLCTRV